MFAEVIPYTRSIRGVDSFDYAIPTHLAEDIGVGTTVWIPFRSKVIPGVVRTLKERAEFDEVKHIDSIHPLQLWTERVPLIEWFAQHYGVSLATAFKAMQFPLLKKARNTEMECTSGSASASNGNYSLAAGEVLLHYTKRVECLNEYTKLFHAHTGNTLVVVAEYGHIHEIIRSVPTSKKYIVIHEAASPSFMFRLALLLEQHSDLIVVGTKKAAFLPFDLFSAVIMDQEEAIAHKQFDSNPRYHVRPVIHRAATLSGTPVLYTSCAPSITLMHAASHGAVQVQSTVLPGSNDGDALLVVNMEQEYESQNYSWFSEKLIAHIQKNKRVLLLLNRAGTYQLAQCRDCEELQSSTVNACSNCRSTNLKRMRKGTQQIEAELRTLFPHKTIVRIDRTNETVTTREIHNADIVIGTEKALRDTDIDSFGVVGILSVDHLLVYPHFRSQERVFQLVQYIRSYNTPVILQTHAPEHVVIKHLRRNDYNGFAEQELVLRKMLSLPPFKERVRVRVNQTSEWQLLKSIDKLSAFSPTVQIDREE